MADKNKAKALRLQRRKFSGRKGLFGSPERPRLSVFRSSKHIYAQLVDDYAGKTLAYVGTSASEVRGSELKNGGNIARRPHLPRASEGPCRRSACRRIAVLTDLRLAARL